MSVPNQEGTGEWGREDNCHKIVEYVDYPQGISTTQREAVYKMLNM